jgi:hypothetical protein
MPEALDDLTVTGAPESEPLIVRQTESFSWLRESAAPQANPFYRPPPVLSTISAIDGADEAFMKIVFNQLADGETGVAPNADRSVYYVVKVKNRMYSKPEAEETLRQTFLTENFFFFSPFANLMQMEQSNANYHWSVDLEKKYAVRWNEERAQSAN